MKPMTGCPECGAPPLEGKKYCSECGAPVRGDAPPTPRDEGTPAGSPSNSPPVSRSREVLQRLSEGEEASSPSGAQGVDLRDSILYSKGDIIIQNSPVPANPAEASKVYLLTGPDKGRAIPLTRKVTRIGKDGANEIALSYDREASRWHAEIVRDQGTYRLKDLKSRNGTLLGDEKVTSPMELKVGDIIRIGSTTLGFETTGAGATTAAGPLEDAPAPSRLLLRIEKGESVGKTFSFQIAPGSQWTIGRGEQCAVFTGSKDRSVSHRHARVVVDQDTSVTLVDDGSVNGTVLNGRKLAKGLPQPLAAHDVIAVGATRIFVDLQ